MKKLAAVLCAMAVVALAGCCCCQPDCPPPCAYKGEAPCPCTK